MDWSPYAVGGAAARGDSFTGLDPQFASSVYQMVRDAHAAGIPLQITSAYRSPEVQARLYEAAIAKYGSPEAARKWVAPPGRSRHNSGTAVDFAVNGSLIRDADSPEAQWIAENAPKYGLGVPMAWEPWQVEPVGSRDGTAQPAQAPQEGGNALAAMSPRQEPENSLARYRGVQNDPRAFMAPTNQLALMSYDKQSNPFLRFLS